MIITLLIGCLLTKNSVGKEIDIAPTEYVYIQSNSLVAPRIETPKKVISLAYLIKESILPTEELMNCLIQCESGGNPEKINWDDCGSPSYGLLQYKLPTWNNNCAGEIMNGQDQIKCAKNMIQNGQIRAWTNCGITCGAIKP